MKKIIWIGLLLISCNAENAGMKSKCKITGLDFNTYGIADTLENNCLKFSDSDTIRNNFFVFDLFFYTQCFNPPDDKNMAYLKFDDIEDITIVLTKDNKQSDITDSLVYDSSFTKVEINEKKINKQVIKLDCTPLTTVYSSVESFITSYNAKKRVLEDELNSPGVRLFYKNNQLPQGEYTLESTVSFPNRKVVKKKVVYWK